MGKIACSHRPDRPGRLICLVPCLFFWHRYKHRIGLLLGLVFAMADVSRAQVTLSPSTVVFPSTYMGNSAPAQAITVANSTSSSVFISYFVMGNDFSYQGNCPVTSATGGGTLSAGASCTISVGFTPSSVGTETANLFLYVYDVNFQMIGQATAALTGTGLSPLTFSPSAVDFGYVVVHTTSAAIPVVMTNKGSLDLQVGYNDWSSGSSSNYDFQVNGCVGELAPGASCTLQASFRPSEIGPETGVFSITAWYSKDGMWQYIQTTLSFSGIGHAIGVSSSVVFPLQLIGTTGYQGAMVSNNSDSTVNVNLQATVTGSAFSLTENDCTGSLAHGSCYVGVAFKPTAAGESTGTLTLTYNDPLSPQVIPISGTGTAIKVSADPNYGSAFLFGSQPLLIASAPKVVQLTNVGTVSVPVLGVTAPEDYDVSNGCKKSIAAGQTCSISIASLPQSDGVKDGSLQIQLADPISPQTFPLIADGVGIGNAKIRLHYDYMVAPDHTHDPEVTSPGAIQRIVDAFAAHGIELIIDPHHTAIPEVTPIVAPTRDGTTSDPYLPNAVSFYTLRNRYYTPKYPDEHYVIFAHDSVDPQDTRVTSQTGEAEWPGLNFVVSLAPLQGVNWRADQLSFATSSITMHELGHNLGLHHFGAFGLWDMAFDYQDNYKPNYISIMDYFFVNGGLIQGTSPGSTTIKNCSSDTDCGVAQSCISYTAPNEPPAKSCRRLDYSTQALPTGGNTPGALDDNDLDETAGLGSGSSDLFPFYPCAPGGFTVEASNGPVDWDRDGDAADLHVAVDIDLDDNPDCTTLHQHFGWDDWGHLLGTSTESGTAPDAAASSSLLQSSSKLAESGGDLDVETLRKNHALYPIRPAEIRILQGCAALPDGANTARGNFVVALLGGPNFDVNQVDLSSLLFHGARPASTSLADVNKDRHVDLVIAFSGNDMRLSRQATRVQLSGWLKNSQLFFAQATLGATSCK